jgi:hypothetical protein
MVDDAGVNLLKGMTDEELEEILVQAKSVKPVRTDDAYLRELGCSEKAIKFIKKMRKEAGLGIGNGQDDPGKSQNRN